ncbi:MAG: 1-acyl-sn-glycerol-3-phosphate acyltransferase [Propionibacteriaceae bacterium]|nr:1-acyl-sn-glycerol-3-phosphate acyltransferase [Propionibacteriaceae bacterium]
MSEDLETVNEHPRSKYVAYTIFRAIFRPIVTILFRGKIINAKRIPAEGGIILTSNHLGALDPVILAGLAKRHITFPAKIELYEGKGIKRIVGWFLNAVGMVPLNRADPKLANAALQPLIERVQEGGAIGIYPEGTRSPDGRMYKGKTGVARILMATGATVVPFGTFDSHSHRTRIGIPWVTKPKLVIGEPMDLSEYAGREVDHELLREITDKIMKAIWEITGQEYVDVYGKEMKYHLLPEAEIEAKVLPYPGAAADGELEG